MSPKWSKKMSDASLQEKAKLTQNPTKLKQMFGNIVTSPKALKTSASSKMLSPKSPQSKGYPMQR